MGLSSGDPGAFRIAVLAAHWLGDTFWGLQLVPFLRSRFPSAQIDLLVHPENRWLAELWAPKQRVHDVHGLVRDRLREGSWSPWTLWRRSRQLRARLGKVDLFIDLTGTPASGFLTRLVGPRRSIGLAGRGFCSLFYNTFRTTGDFRGHLAKRPWWLLEPHYGGFAAWPSADEQMQPLLPGSPEWQARGADAVLLFPGAGWMQKQWPLELFVDLAKQLQRDGQSAYLLFSEREQALAARSPALDVESSGIQIRVTDGPAMLRMLRSATAVVANDSGGAHLAAAWGIPTVALFGPTNPGICGPLGRTTRILRTSCQDRPEGGQHHCHDRPAYNCPRTCMESISPRQVRDALISLLQE
ncbi:MAG: glycosyltransferase family 9 protein [Candidatus Eisenbacteria sp.]|nr:glycosyltransferase family 9 protein [Candidatus Eisenbacteria bacterium]